MNGSSERSLPYLFLGPALLVMLLVVVYPFGYNIWISLTNMNLYHLRDPTFLGFEHYRNILGEPELVAVFIKTVLWTVVNIFFHVTIGTALALLLNQEIRGRSVFRALLILPWAMPQYITALTWRGMFNFEYGQVNLILTEWFGFEAIPWFGSETWAFTAAILTNIWLGFPFMMIVALGGLQSIPEEMYEAARIDGAGRWQRMREITLPLLRPVMVPAILLGTIWTFNNLNVIWLVTNGGEPADKSHILVSQVYKAAFTYYRYGYAAAFSMVIFLILLVLVIVYMRQTRATERVY
ncbi:MAG: sugar ABC transporter permease [Gemmatimonadota bacterium]|nr:MAG: sugar ABC transporter permease [Gemmatimonadota bacterium]